MTARPAAPSAPPVVALDLGPGVLAGVTGRAGGVSTGPWRGLNLGGHVGDDPAHVATNRDLLDRWAGAPVRFGRQVHGTGVRVVDGRIDGHPSVGADEDTCDALVTATPGVPLGVLVADCVPVLLADPVARVVAVAHAGRRGLLDGVLQATVATMRSRGADPTRVRAAIGPCAGPCCYEVPAAMADEAVAVLPSVRARTRAGTPSLDLRAGCREALAAAGVPAASVAVLDRCTVDDETYYSYRRAKVTGRFAGVVALAG